MKVLKTKKFAQVFYPREFSPQHMKEKTFIGDKPEVPPEDKIVTDETEEEIIEEEQLPTLTPDDINQYIIDDIEEKEGEIPTEVEIPTEDGVRTELVDTTVPTEEEQEEAEEYPKFVSLIEAFRWAKENKKVIRIYYHTIKGNYLIRDVEPHGDFWARTTLKRILVTWDKTAENLGMTARGGIPFARAFRLENVEKYEFTGESFKPKFNFSQRTNDHKYKIRSDKD